jgi:hypothetical protein
LDQAAHQRCNAIHGESQARTALIARGQEDGGGAGAAGGPPLSAAGFRLRCRNVVVRWVISEPGVPQKLNAQLTSTWWMEMNVTPGATTQTETDVFNVIGQGSAPNFTVRGVTHMTVNANGDVTASIDHLTTTGNCIHS